MRTFPGRFELIRAGLLLAAALCSGAAAAQDVWPSRPIRIIVPSPAGGLPDVAARLITKPIGDALGQPLVMDPRPGVAGNIAADLTAKAKPDGYTFLLTTMSTHGIAPSIFKTLPFHPVDDFVAVARVMENPLVLYVSDTTGIKNINDLIAYARANPGKLNYGSVGPGSVSHLAVAMLAAASHLRMVHVPFKGYADVQQGLKSGDLQLAFLPGYTSTPGGTSVAVASRTRFARMPNLPTLVELGMTEVYLGNWFGFVAPAKTPQAIVERFADQLAIAMKDPALLERLQGISAVPSFLRTREFEAFYVGEIARLRPVVAAAGATAAD